MLLKPFKMVGDFFTWVFKSLLCCCFYGGRDLKADIALIKDIRNAPHSTEGELKAVMTKLYDFSSAIQKDVVQAHVNYKMESKSVDLEDAKAVAAYKTGHPKDITKWEKQITDLFSKKDMKVDPTKIMDRLQDVQAKLEKEAKPETK